MSRMPLLPFHRPITERFSCRAYKPKPIAAYLADRLQAVTDSVHTGPLQTPLRFEGALTMEFDTQALRGLVLLFLLKIPSHPIVPAQSG